jgi:ABC-2 type transport system ATP-binding protein
MQAAALDPTMTGREHLELVAGFRGLRGRTRRATAEKSLARFGLSDAAERQVRTYSGGMKRRLDLAGALLHHPQILFLDEPATGLDAQSRRALWEETGTLRAAGSAIFLTTQYIEEADRLADRVAILDRGVVAADGTPGELRQRVGGVELTIRLATSTPEARPLPLADGRVVSVAADGVVRVPVPATSEAFEVLDRARTSWPIRSARIEAPTLEDVFLEVTGRAVSEVPPVLESVASKE